MTWPCSCFIGLIPIISDFHTKCSKMLYFICADSIVCLPFSLSAVKWSQALETSSFIMISIQTLPSNSINYSFLYTLCVTRFMENKCMNMSRTETSTDCLISVSACLDFSVNWTGFPTSHETQSTCKLPIKVQSYI